MCSTLPLGREAISASKKRRRTAVHSLGQTGETAIPVAPCDPFHCAARARGATKRASGNDHREDWGCWAWDGRHGLQQLRPPSFPIPQGPQVPRSPPACPSPANLLEGPAFLRFSLFSFLSGPPFKPPGLPHHLKPRCDQTSRPKSLSLRSFSTRRAGYGDCHRLRVAAPRPPLAGIGWERLDETNRKREGRYRQPPNSTQRPDPTVLSQQNPPLWFLGPATLPTTSQVSQQSSAPLPFSRREQTSPTGHPFGRRRSAESPLIHNNIQQLEPQNISIGLFRPLFLSLVFVGESRNWGHRHRVVFLFVCFFVLLFTLHPAPPGGWVSCSDTYLAPAPCHPKSKRIFETLLSANASA